MARLLRPYIPISVRLIVIDRQLAARRIKVNLEVVMGCKVNKTDELALKLAAAFPGELVHLDHDPALENRQRVLYHGKIDHYIPDANDPDYLFYRPAESHRIKTLVRGDHGARSDAGERRHQKRMEENRGIRKRKPKSKIAQRKNPWPPKGSRKFGKRWRGTEWGKR